MCEHPDVVVDLLHVDLLYVTLTPQLLVLLIKLSPSSPLPRHPLTPHILRLVFGKTRATLPLYYLSLSLSL